MAITNSLLATIMPYLPKVLVRPFAKPYVAGESIDSVIKITKKLNDNGFSTTLDILCPTLSIFNSLINFELVSLSEDNGETAIGRGSRFPLVISTSINAFD